jgi:hypothetical protein
VRRCDTVAAPWRQVGERDAIVSTTGFASREVILLMVLRYSRGTHGYYGRVFATREAIRDNRMVPLTASACVVCANTAVLCSCRRSVRQVFELRGEFGQDHSRDFLTVGSMGHASAIAMGIALASPSRCGPVSAANRPPAPRRLSRNRPGPARSRLPSRPYQREYFRRARRNVVCLDGDGALAMHMGNALTIGLRWGACYAQCVGRVYGATWTVSRERP